MNTKQQVFSFTWAENSPSKLTRLSIRNYLELKTYDVNHYIFHELSQVSLPLKKVSECHVKFSFVQTPVKE